MHAFTFACIWLALGLLSWDLRRRLRYERSFSAAPAPAHAVRPGAPDLVRTPRE